MAKNTKLYTAAAATLGSLEKQLAAEAKLDPRFKKAHGRTKRLVALTFLALAKYELLHSRKVPAKVQAKTGGKKAAAKKAPKRAAKKSNVVQLHASKKAAAARKAVAVKRSAKRK